MGKRILVQRRGRGSPTFRASTHKRVAPVSLPPPEKAGVASTIRGVVRELLHDPGRGTPLAKIVFEDSSECYVAAPEGMYIGQVVEMGTGVAVDIGNVLPLSEIPEGTMVCNVELHEGDGGKLARASGSYAVVEAHLPDGVLLRLPSGKAKVVKERCRAMVGVVSSVGRIEKPFLKAGKKFWWMRAKGHKYPRVRGVAMIAAYHPFGGGRHQHPGKPTTVSRNAPPGKKVGHIAARSTGRGRKKRKRKV